MSGHQTDERPALTELTCLVPSLDPHLPIWEEGKDSVRKGFHQAQARDTAAGRNNTQVSDVQETFFVK